MAENKYADERYNPTLPHCGGEVKMTLKFNGKNLVLRGVKGMYIYPAVSGKPEIDITPVKKINPPHLKANLYNEMEKARIKYMAEKALTEAGIIDYSRFNYNKRAQQLPDVGPIPEGIYWINPAQISEAGFFRNRNSWGDFRITIHPFTTTETYNRGGFFIHGGSEFGTKGCIDLATHMNRFIADLKKEVDGEFLHNMCQIHLFVSYK